MIGIIPAAGAGTRFKELGKQYSKTILPYKEKPILIHQIEWLERQGCNDIRVVVNHRQEEIKEILKMYNMSVSIFTQEVMNGLSGAILSALNESDNDSVLISLGDIVITSDIDKVQFKDHFISVQEVYDYSRWCMVKDDLNGKLTFFDKPIKSPPTTTAASGVYFFKDANILYNLLIKQCQHENCKVNGEYQISTILQHISETEGMFTTNLSIVDFGTLDEYLHNRSVKNSRSFNDITINDMIVTKSSTIEREKLIKEVNWFKNIPPEIQLNTPRIFDSSFYSKVAWYKMEKVLAPSLREIYLFLDSTEETWESIFNSSFDMLSKLETYGSQNNFLKGVVKKTKERVADINIPIENKFVNSFISELESQIRFFSRPSLMDGGFCFSNLLYNFQNNRIIMIDPRGELFGDHYYEVAKLCHSVLYDYDFIDAELYIKEGDEYKIYNNGKSEIKDLFSKMLKQRYSDNEIKFIMLLTASLFLSMIPLHSHNQTNQLLYYKVFKEICNKGIFNV